MLGYYITLVCYLQAAVAKCCFRLLTQTEIGKQKKIYCGVVDPGTV